jgi:hypothetical protein
MKISLRSPDSKIRAFEKGNVVTIKYLAGTCPVSSAPMAGLRGTI